jgi:hypothetical protein
MFIGGGRRNQVAKNTMHHCDTAVHFDQRGHGCYNVSCFPNCPGNCAATTVWGCAGLPTGDCDNPAEGVGNVTAAPNGTVLHLGPVKARYTTPPWSTEFPELGALLAGPLAAQLGDPVLNQIVGNVACGCGAFLPPTCSDSGKTCADDIRDRWVGVVHSNVVRPNCSGAGWKGAAMKSDEDRAVAPVPKQAPKLETYPAPAPNFPTGPFTVAVAQGTAVPQDSFVYITQQGGRAQSWTTFSFEGGAATVAVTPAKNWSTCVLRPLSLGLSAQRRGDAAVFTVPAGAPAKVIAEFGGDVDHTLAVFGDPLPPAAPTNGTRAVTFGPGVHDIGQNYAVRRGMTVHIAGGAWVRGTLSGRSAHGATIEGRGVLSGERLKHPPKATDDLAMLNLCGSGITVRGIHIVNPPTYMVNINPYWTMCFGRNALVDNVKAISWYGTGDGVMVGPDSVVRDSYVRANDDSLKLYSSHTLWERNLVWQNGNGFSFMMSWNTALPARNLTVRDCTVLRSESRAVFGAVHGGGAALSDYLFENIIVEGDVQKPFSITVATNPWGGTADGTIRGVVFRNVTFTGSGKSHSVLKGHGPAAGPGGMSNFSFDGLSIGGAAVTAASAGQFFDIDAATVANVSFASPLKSDDVHGVIPEPLPPAPAMPWPSTYELSRSTMVFVDGNHTGPDNAARAAAEARYGMVTFGWETKVCATARPASPPRACTYAGTEAALDAAAARLKAINSDVKVALYRNTELGLSIYKDQCEKMYDPAYSGFYLKNSSGALINERAAFPGDGVSACPGEPPAGGWFMDQQFTDFRNASAAAWFVDTVVGRVARSPHADGVWFDDPSGVGAEHPAVTKAFSPAQLSIIRAATAVALQRAAASLIASGKPLNFNVRGVGLRGVTPVIGTAKGRDTQVCIAALRAGAALGATNAPSVYQLAFTPNGSSVAAADFQQHLAAFLLTRGQYSWFGFSWISAYIPPWYPEWDWDVGTPSGAMVEHVGGVFSRVWSKGTVVINCTSWEVQLPFE